MIASRVRIVGQLWKRTARYCKRWAEEPDLVAMHRKVQLAALVMRHAGKGRPRQRIAVWPLLSLHAASSSQYSVSGLHQSKFKCSQSCDVQGIFV